MCTLQFFVCLVFSSSFVLTNTIPEQVHIAFGGPYSMTISWFTLNNTATSTVKYGLNPFKLKMSEAGSSVQYLADHGYHHTVGLTGLTPNTYYFYAVGDENGGFSSTFGFQSPSDSNTEPFSFACFGDMGYLDDQQRPKMIYVDGLQKNWTAIPTRELLESLKNDGKIDFIWHVGDIGYADDSFAENLVKFEYEKAYNGYMNWLQNLTSTLPYMVVPGNHESECHSGVCFLDAVIGEALRNFTAYNHRWKMPSSTSDGVLSMWYSFDYGPVHFVGMNTETDFPGSGEENRGDSGFLPAGHFAPNGTYLKWLENDLMKASLARSTKAPGYRNWIIAGGHRPYWEILGNGVEEMFLKYGVDLYFAGHMHSYLRTLPVAKGEVDKKSVKSANHYHDAQSPVYIVSGGAGCDEMNFVADPLSLIYSNIINSSSPYDFGLGFGTANFTTDRVSLGVLDVANQTAVHWVLYDSFDHSIIDEVWLTKSE